MASPLVCPPIAPEYYVYVGHTIAFVSFPFNFLAFYLVWFHSPKTSKYRHCLLYLQLITLIAEIEVNIVTPGYYFFRCSEDTSLHGLENMFLAIRQLLSFFSAEITVSRKVNQVVKYGFVIFTHIFPFATATCVYNSRITYQEQYMVLAKYYPNCKHIMLIRSIEIYDYRVNPWIAGICLSAFLFIFISVIYFIYMLNYAELATNMTFFIGSHSLCSSVVMLLTNPRYRKIIYDSLKKPPKHIVFRITENTLKNTNIT
ncbi:unnamed protein product [Caenorhabditis bovis]|uniref:Uncharacterized protein n=1 Tax=Caenorhabditis bovis TaxID=2654633 RepID=A0A8S1EYE3_9PELO|nr:unnamed protein product [Caenorhabditis bovis]